MSSVASGLRGSDVCVTGLHASVSGTCLGTPNVSVKTVDGGPQTPKGIIELLVDVFPSLYPRLSYQLWSKIERCH